MYSVFFFLHTWKINKSSLWDALKGSCFFPTDRTDPDPDPAIILHLFRLRVASQLHLNNFESPLHHLTSARLQDDTRQNASLWMSQLVSP